MPTCTEEKELLESKRRLQISLNSYNPPKIISVKEENLVAININQNTAKFYQETNDPAEAFVGTVYIFMNELQYCQKLPDLVDKKLSMIFVGASDKYENNSTNCNFELLFECLKENFYPDLFKLEITLVGTEVTSKSETLSRNGKVSQVNYNNTLEAKYTNATLPLFSLGFVLHPGFSSYLDIWKPAIDLLINSNIPCLCGGYSLVTMLTDDALFDEDAIRRYYGGNIVCPRSYNPRYYQFGFKPFHNRNAFIFIFQGRNNTKGFVPMSRHEYLKDMFARFMKSQGDYYGINHPDYKRQCYIIAEKLLNGNIPPDSLTTEKLVQMANRYLY